MLLQRSAHLVYSVLSNGFYMGLNTALITSQVLSKRAERFILQKQQETLFGASTPVLEPDGLGVISRARSTDFDETIQLLLYSKLKSVIDLIVNDSIDELCDKSREPDNLYFGMRHLSLVFDTLPESPTNGLNIV